MAHRIFKRTAWVRQKDSTRIVEECGRMPSVFVVIDPLRNICEGDRVLCQFHGSDMATTAVNKAVTEAFCGVSFKYVEVR